MSYMPLACACDAAKNSRAGRQTFDRRLRTAALLTTSVVTRGEDARGPLVSHTSTASVVAGKHALSDAAAITNASPGTPPTRPRAAKTL